MIGVWVGGRVSFVVHALVLGGECVSVQQVHEEGARFGGTCGTKISIVRVAGAEHSQAARELNEPHGRHMSG
jgi:hypothetical protein